jgi:ribokinase
MSLVVYGSANVDRVYRVPQIPGPGETVLASGHEQHLGGKGNNQATAAVRAGADVGFITALGDDEPGALISNGLAEAGIRPLVRWMDERTGSALITVDQAGENSIVVDPGAYGRLGRLNQDELAAIADADLLLMQLEIPVPAVSDAAQHAQRRQTAVVLNAAPMTTLPADLLAAVDVLIVNETEAQQLANSDQPSWQDLVRLVPAVITTLGSRGAQVATRDEGAETVAARHVPVTDTTGAGDTFCGALVAELDRRAGGRVSDLSDLAAATEFATVAAALSVQRSGAVPSIPTRAEIDATSAEP